MTTDRNVDIAQENPWLLVLERLRTSLDEHSFRTWFAQTAFESCENGVMRIGVPSQFFADWLRAHNRSRFLLTAPPLRLPGAVGSPDTPVATV